MSSLLNAATSLVDQARYTSNFILGTFILPAKPLQRFLPLPAAPSVKASTLHASDAGGDFTIIVGGTAGIGKEMVYAMAKRGADVILACRNVGKGESVRQELLFRAAQTPGTRVNLKIRVAQLDTSDLESVKKFAKGVDSTLAKANKKIRFLFLNAGIARPSSSETPFTKDGMERLYLTNFLGHFLLLHLLESHLGSNTRVISTSSAGGLFASHPGTIASHSEPFKKEIGFHVSTSMGNLAKLPLPRIKQIVYDQGGITYAQTKGMQILLGRALVRHFQNRVTQKQSSPAPDNASLKSTSSSRVRDDDPASTPFFAAFHPGLVASDIFTPGGERETWATDVMAKSLTSVISYSGLSTEEGITTALWLAFTPREELEGWRSGLLGRVAGLSGIGGNGRFWTRNACEVAPQDKVSEQAMQRWWDRWCTDAGIQWEL